MSAVSTHPPGPSVSTSRLPRRRVWTCDDLNRFREMRDAWFGGYRFILIDGEILEMPPPGPLHNMVVGLTEEWARRAFPIPRYWVRVQMGMPLGVNTDPVPDLAIVPGTPRDYPADPNTAELVIEVADSSLSYDTGAKASLYAAAGIRDYWVIDIEHRRLFVYRAPRPDPAATYGHGYSRQTTLGPADTITPLAAPNAGVTVAELLP